MTMLWNFALDAAAVGPERTCWMLAAAQAEHQCSRGSAAAVVSSCDASEPLLAIARAAIARCGFSAWRIGSVAF